MTLARGTTPPGAASEEQASRWVRGMFGRVARRYDLLNHLLSFQMDRFWRAHTARRVSEVLRQPRARVLDLCCGTGDLLLALAARRGGLVYGADFCHPMLVEARRKIGPRPAVVFEADALRLPLADASFDLITVAFGLRNLANYHHGLKELRRVLRPGGVLAILEFSQPPRRILARFYGFYSTHILPRIGGLISGAGDAYTYLPESIGRFPDAETLAAEMRATSYSSVEFERLTCGIVALHIGRA
jgi:demethylmenaquinone methyltransferase/2-methoxy-6-polyprenyl-1,4-benzoquinol methylase